MFFKYLNEIGITTGLFAPKRDKEFRRIDVEYLMKLRETNQEETEDILIQGLQSDMDMQNQLLFHEMKGIRKGVQLMAKEVTDLKNMFNQSQQILQDILESVRSPGAVKAAEYARQAAQNMLDSLHMNEKRASRLLSETLTLLKKAVKINDYDYKAHFDLGWLHDYYLSDLDGAEYHYDTAVLRSLRKDKNFAVFSLRHLAEVRRIKGDTKGALEAIAEACQLDESGNCEIKYELALNLAANAQIDAAVKELEPVVRQNSIYYMQVASDPALTGINEIEKMLFRLNATQVDESRKGINRAWDDFKGRCSFMTKEELYKVKGQVTKMLASLEQFHYVELPLLSSLVAEKLESLYKKCLMEEQKKLMREKRSEEALLKGEEKPWEAAGKKIYSKRKMIVTLSIAFLVLSFIVAFIVVTYSLTPKKTDSDTMNTPVPMGREGHSAFPGKPESSEGFLNLKNLGASDYKLIKPKKNSHFGIQAQQEPQKKSQEIFNWDNWKPDGGTTNNINPFGRQAESPDRRQIEELKKLSESRKELLKKQYRSQIPSYSGRDMERLKELYGGKF